MTQSGTSVTAASLGYDSVISPGASVSVGFQGTWNASDAAPSSFRLNAVACT